MSAEQLFGLLVRCSGLGLSIYGLYYFFGAAWRIVLNVDGGVLYQTGSLVYSVLFLAAGVLIMRAASFIVRFTYRSKP